MDEGRLTDGQARVVDFKNTILVLTSNLGGELLTVDDKAVEERCGRLSKTHSDPEFLNRLDEILIFHRLRRQDVARIVAVQLKKLVRRIEELGLSWKFSPPPRSGWLTKATTRPTARRPLKRLIQTELENPLAEMLLAEKPPKLVKVPRTPAACS